MFLPEKYTKRLRSPRLVNYIGFLADYRNFSDLNPRRGTGALSILLME
jgi:hypothetical protein